MTFSNNQNGKFSNFQAFKTDNDSKKDQEEHVSLLNNRNKKSQTKNKYQDAELSYAVVPS
jgi:hypothetical protein